MFTIKEIFDMLLMTAVLGYIFSDLFKTDYDPYNINSKKFSWENYKVPIMVTAPSIIFHELGHKFVALSFGFAAEFHAAYEWLAAAVVLKLIGFPFIFFVPAYVSISGNPTYLQSAAMSFAGPCVNLILWLGTLTYLKLNKKKLSKIKHITLILTKQINMWLFIFNMIPIPFFDGFSVYSNLYHALI